MPTKIVKASIPDDRRILAISDIHAHKSRLLKLLDKAGFCDADELVIIGDLLARGSDSLGVLTHLMALSEKPNVHVLKGNMEMWHLYLLDDDTDDGNAAFLSQVQRQCKHFGSALFQQMADSLSVRLSTLSDVPAAKAAIREGFAAEIAFMRNMPDILDTPHIIFVHGGIPTDDLDSLREMDCIQFLKNDCYMQKGHRFDKTLILGHWPATLYHGNPICHMPYINKDQNMIEIDGGCGIKVDGQLNALIIYGASPLDATALYYDEFPIGIAATDQAASESFTHITFYDPDVTILEHGDTFTWVEHVSTGKRFHVLTENLWDVHGLSGKCEFTDYRINVRSGEHLSIVRNTERGYLVKKDGRTGWYTGGITMV